ncbi:uncharacterized protein LOC129003910 [Macrosteles quadrilineatus]|uniref:uncharacterized protein LOC129003910 n=1 Tax=Macrosteles quadrilineatus TaxID=74068 RepID=UPI0023E18236|nr:uncharacterized protein LOC129003910 [Macrosteles quadrilineatus]
MTIASFCLGCQISEFRCRNGKCVRLDNYCNTIDDCGDMSDEPRYCTVCNRTYYGDVGKTYQLHLHKPQEGRLPFLCHLTFTANGHNHGELVQLIFDAFNVGRFSATALDGCPDGHMQLMELGRPYTGGSWCGAAAGHAVYYSETATVTLTLRVYHAAAPFEFLLRFKMLGADEAVVRFGSPGAPIDRGEVVPGTYCSRNFYECYRKKCRLQSPNYPGMYPRNVTCYLTMRQKTVPTCKHAMISVRQQNHHKMQIRSTVTSDSSNNGTSATSGGGGGGGIMRELRAWSECTGDRDHLIFYDGASTDDPVIAKYCGGTWLPAVISRGPAMLVAFHSSPFSVPLRSDGAASPLRGFELDVDILYSDSFSLDYSRHARKCEFWVNATHPDLDDTARTRGRTGYVSSPRHTLAPNTTCTYHFRGHSRDHVWLYFISYSHQPLRPNTTHNCSTRLRIWDGGGSLLGDHCDGPRLCDHTSLRNLTRVTRPCLITESYVTRTSELLVQHQSDDGTALHPSHFRARYEFVDTWLGGEPWTGRRGETPPPQPCSRVFRKVKSGYIKSPRNIFLYGRGGAKNLSCVYRLEASPGEKVRLTLHNASFGETDCSADKDPHTGRTVCVRQPGTRLVELQVADVPWRDVRVVRGCYCDNSSLPTTSTAGSVVFTSLSRVLEITFVISKFNITEDFADLYFHATFEMINSPDCPRKQRVRGSGGEIELVSPPQLRADVNCEGLPWLVEAHENKSLFLLTWGHFLPLTGEPDAASCSTKNRVLLYTGRPLRLLKVVCPSTPKERQFAVHVFSEEWYLQPTPGSSSEPFLQPPRPPSFLLEFVGRESGVAALNWLEISRSKSALLQQLHTDYPDTLEPPGNESVSVPGWECPYRCPELNACISSSLWCDGRPNCPSGYDESPTHCGVGRQLLAILPTYAAFGGVAASIAALLLFLLAALLHRVRLRRQRRLLGKVGSAHRVPTEELLLDPSTATSTMSS